MVVYNPELYIFDFEELIMTVNLFEKIKSINNLDIFWVVF